MDEIINKLKELNNKNSTPTGSSDDLYKKINLEQRLLLIKLTNAWRV
jgi:hypothetical protein